MYGRNICVFNFYANTTARLQGIYDKRPKVCYNGFKWYKCMKAFR